MIETRFESCLDHNSLRSQIEQLSSTNTHASTHSQYMHTHTRAHTHARTHTRSHARTHARTKTHTHACARTHARTQTHTHTHTHTHTQTRGGRGEREHSMPAYMYTPTRAHTERVISLPPVCCELQTPVVRRKG